jgi:YD repeat-containing protein
VTETRRKAKPGTGLADIVTSATYPTSCSSIFTCNKPLTTTDANGNITTYTYDAAHGGVLTASGPAVGGVPPRTKYSYAQRHAWIRNAGGGYSQAASPVWVLTEERTCRTSTLNLSTGACSAGTSDRVTTVYDYGPDSGPNNLWLRGVAVTANSQTLRTCYGYDEYGRRISETAPNANPPSCS